MKFMITAVVIRQPLVITVKLHLKGTNELFQTKLCCFITYFIREHNQHKNNH